jgi:hypothetical protein
MGWMDQAHDAPAKGAAAGKANKPSIPGAVESPMPQDDDERFIVGLVLTYYRRHPERARTRLLDLLGEVLMPTAAPASAKPSSPSAQKPADDPHSLWERSQKGVAPLKRKH